MRLLKILLGLLVVLALAVLLANNSSQSVDIWLYPGKTLLGVNLATTLVSTLAIGIILGFLIGLLQILGQQRNIAGQNRRLKKLRNELNSLRHSGLEADTLPTDEGTEVPDQDDIPSSGELLQLEK